MRHRVLGTSVVVLLAFASLAAPAAHAAAPPAAASLVSPASGSTVAPGTALQVAVTDPDDDPMTVTFHAAVRGQEDGTSPAAPFTFLVLPDTQGYVITPTYTSILDAQLHWIVENRVRLNLAFMTGLGDIVDNQISAAQWGRASSSMAILDDGHVPYAVVPGNHDFNLTTGDFTGYDTYFPVSRFRDATWNSPAAHYGGYYGQSEFGPDAGDRQNMNSYSVFQAGGMDFLLLDLELNPPDPVLDWATRVLAAHPDHRTIIATHSYVFTSGALANQVLRTDVPGNSGAQIFQKLVFPHCSVFLVVNGHFSDGTDGEANRVDQNACGDPVYGALSDFQGRPNGGDGWLRYYTFSPAEGTITATTYSPSRDEFETDSDSVFTMAYDMAPPADLPVIGSVTVPSGQTASFPLLDAPDGAVIDWYAVADDGSTSTRSATWQVTVSDAPVASVLASDQFSRTVAAGWGSADTGGAWTVNSTAKLTADGSAGRISSNAGSTLTATLGTVSATDVDLTTQFTIDRIPTQWIGVSVAPRQIGTSAYSARARILPNQAIALELLRDSTLLTSRVIPGLTATAGVPIHIRVQTQGTSPTQLRTRIWADGTPEPTDWQLDTTDNTASHQTPGSIRLTSYLSSTATNGPVILTWDNLTATTLE